MNEDLIYNTAENQSHELPLLLSLSRPGIYISTYLKEWGFVFLKEENRAKFSK
jgi:hypothetical protein